MRKRTVKITLLTILTIVIIGLVGTGIALYRGFMEAMYDIYAPIGAADLLIEHMKANNDAWPRSWEELHKTFLLVQEQGGSFRGFDWDQYRRHVWIDFAADPARIVADAEAGKPMPRVVWSTGNVERFPGSTDLNQRLLLYFKEMTARKATFKGQPQERPSADRHR